MDYAKCMSKQESKNTYMDSENMNEAFVEVPGGKVFVKTWGAALSDSAMSVILLHDSLGCVETWRDFPKKLSEKLNRTVIAYDRLGFGKSSERNSLPSVDFVKEEAEIYLPTILKQLGIGSCILMGHSVGGGMALSAAAFNSNIKAVISESAQAFVEERTKNGIEASKAAFQDPARLEKLKKYHGEKAAWVVRAWTDVWLAPEFATWSLKPILPKVQCPSLIIHGDSDEYGSLVFPDLICGKLGGVVMKKIMSGCGHVPHKEKENDVLEVIAEFFEKNQMP